MCYRVEFGVDDLLSFVFVFEEFKSMFDYKFRIRELWYFSYLIKNGFFIWLVIVVIDVI